MLSPNEDDILNAFMEYEASEEDGTTADFLRSKGLLRSKSDEIRFSMFRSASRPEWQTLAKAFRENGTVASHKNKYQQKIFDMALRVYDETARRSSTSSPNVHHQEVNEDQGALPDPQDLERSMLSLVHNVQAFRTKLENVSTLLENERKAHQKLKKNVCGLENELEGVSDLLSKENLRAKKLLRENTNLKSNDSTKHSKLLASKKEANKKLKKQNAALRRQLTIIVDLYNQSLEDDQKDTGSKHTHSKGFDQDDQSLHKKRKVSKSF